MARLTARRVRCISRRLRMAFARRDIDAVPFTCLLEVELFDFEVTISTRALRKYYRGLRTAGSEGSSESVAGPEESAAAVQPGGEGDGLGVGQAADEVRDPPAAGHPGQ